MSILEGAFTAAIAIARRSVAVAASALVTGGAASEIHRDVARDEPFPALRIAAISPNHGPIGGGTVVRITGTGFVAGASATSFGSLTRVFCRSTTDCEGTTIANPAGAIPTTTEIGVSVAGSVGEANPAGDLFAYDPPPSCFFSRVCASSGYFAMPTMTITCSAPVTFRRGAAIVGAPAMQLSATTGPYADDILACDPALGLRSCARLRASVDYGSCDAPSPVATR